MNYHMDQNQRRQSDLGEFLARARARLRPQDVGLPSIRRRRVRGLRREEVAELVGVSTEWYEMFERGTTGRHFSRRFIQRVADALRLDERERATLNRLALPEVASAVAIFERSVHDGAFESLAAVRDFARSVSGASSFDAATLAGMEALLRIVGRDVMNIASLERAETTPHAIAIGTNAQFADDLLAQTLIDINPATRFGATILCEDPPDHRKVKHHARHFAQAKMPDGRELSVIHDTDPKWYRSSNAKAQRGSSIAVGLFEKGAFRGSVTCIWATTGKRTAIEINALETVAAILELLAS